MYQHYHTRRPSAFITRNCVSATHPTSTMHTLTCNLPHLFSIITLSQSSIRGETRLSGRDYIWHCANVRNVMYHYTDSYVLHRQSLRSPSSTRSESNLSIFHIELSISTFIPKLVTLCIPIILFFQRSAPFSESPYAMRPTDPFPLSPFKLKFLFLSYSSVLLYTFFFVFFIKLAVRISPFSTTVSVDRLHRVHCVIYSVYFPSVSSMLHRHFFPSYNPIHCRPHHRPSHESLKGSQHRALLSYFSRSEFLKFNYQPVIVHDCGRYDGAMFEWRSPTF